jgi:hypothetical protein
VDGVSKKSGNFEMTGTSEQVKKTSFDDPIIQLMIKTKFRYVPRSFGSTIHRAGDRIPCTTGETQENLRQGG